MQYNLCTKKIRNYQTDDNILLFNVHGICRNMLYVTIYNGLEDSIEATGWIEQTDKLMVMPSDGKGNIILRSGYLDKDSIIQNAVQLMTYHASKGREFEYVYMPTLNYDKWEGFRASMKPEIPLHSNEYKCKEELDELRKNQELSFL